jgi:branched-chain amino acid transport system ATP-binding protein
MKPNLVTALGMARTFQNIRLFKNMSVLENVMIARHCRTKAGILGACCAGLGRAGGRKGDRGPEL